MRFWPKKRDAVIPVRLLCPEPGCRNRPMNGIPGEYCSDHYGIEESARRLGEAVDSLGRAFRS